MPTTRNLIATALGGALLLGLVACGPPAGCSSFNVSIAQGAKGAATAQQAVDEWRQGLPPDSGYPSDGWRQTAPESWQSGDATIGVVELDGQGWFVTTGTTCRT
jgi:hypothetical protein